jgi:cytochrome P450
MLGPFASVVRYFADPVGNALALHREHGDIVGLVGGHPGFVLAFGAELNREVLTHPELWAHSAEIPVKSPPGSAMERFGQVLPFTNGEVHKRRRRLLQPAFQRSAIDGYAADFARVCERVLAGWPIGQRVDLVVLLRELTAAIVVKTLFGLDGTLGAAGSDLGRLEAELLDALSSPLSVALPFDVPGTPYRRALQRSTAIEARLRALVAERRGHPDGNDALSILLRARDEDGAVFTEAELVAESNGLFVAGYDTSAQTLAWTLYLLAQHPDVLAPLQAELATGDTARLDRVIKESMRILPGAPMLFMRVAQADAPLGPYTLPAGATVVLSPLVTHREPGRYPEPDRFLPDRWLGLEPSSWEYLPFGVGARMCLGAVFAGQLLRVVLPAILARFVPIVVEGADISRITRGIALSPRRGLPMVLHPPGTSPRAVPVKGDIAELVRLG